MKDNIKVGDWIRHNYGGLNSIEIFKVGKIKDGRCYKEENSTMAESLDWGYTENCTKMTSQQCVNMDVWNDRIHRELSNDFTADEQIAQKEYNKHQCSDPNGKQWIDLCIDNLPDRFFTRDDIEIESMDYTLEYSKSSHTKPDLRHNIIYGLQNEVEYRYRLKPLESIKITRVMLYWLYESQSGKLVISTENMNTQKCVVRKFFDTFETNDYEILFDGSKVKIID